MGDRYDRPNRQQLITGKRLVGDLATGAQHQLRQGAILNADRKKVGITVSLRDVQCDIPAGIRSKSDLELLKSTAPECAVIVEGDQQIRCQLMTDTDAEIGGQLKVANAEATG